MNLLLLLDDYRLDDDRWLITGARARHITDVLGLAAGGQLRSGRPGGRLGRSRVLEMRPDGVLVDFEPGEPPPPALPLTLLLALPRPKMLKRMLIDASSLGIKRIVLLNAWKVDKSYWRTPHLNDDLLREKLLLGLEQACDTIFPEIFLRERFRPFVEDELDAFAGPGPRLLAHPGDHPPLPADLPDPMTLAIGPEGGWTPFEVELLQSRGFVCHSFGERILRVETALPALVGRLMPLVSRA